MRWVVQQFSCSSLVCMPLCPSAAKNVLLLMQLDGDASLI